MPPRDHILRAVESPRIIRTGDHYMSFIQSCFGGNPAGLSISSQAGSPPLAPALSRRGALCAISAAMLVSPDAASALAVPVRSSAVAGLMVQVDRTFSDLENYCATIGNVPLGDAEFDRLDRIVAAAVERLAETPARDHTDLVTKAHALIESPAIEQDPGRCDAVGASLARDVLRLLGGGAS